MRRACARRNRVLVMTDQLSLIRWRVRREAAASDPRCASAAAASPHGRWSASGGAFTAVRCVLVRRRRRYVARFSLPVTGGRRRLAPGSYRLTVIAVNAHGMSRSQTTHLTVLP
jgi:hypothetical protein